MLLTIEDDMVGLLNVVRKEPRDLRWTVASYLAWGSGLCERVTALKSFSLND